MKTILFAAAGLLLAAAAQASTPYERQVEAARAARVAALTGPDGWLTVIGLHFLAPGPSTIGSAPGNAVVLAAGPSHFGTIILSAGKSAAFYRAPGADVKIDGRSAGFAELRTDHSGEEPTRVACGTVSFYLIERGGRIALRVKDSAAAARGHFPGLDTYPVDPAWRIEAKWVSFVPARRVAITDVLGNVSMEKVPGKAVFERGGKAWELFPVLEGPADPLFFVFSDATAETSTYHMRFLYAGQPKGGTVVLDFNLATNPPCAFTPFATCPLPQKENRLALAVTAGEKRFRGSGR
jgi:uncharacterized protein (DUF1684 family)